MIFGPPPPPLSSKIYMKCWKCGGVAAVLATALGTLLCPSRSTRSRNWLNLTNSECKLCDSWEGDGEREVQKSFLIRLILQWILNVPELHMKWRNWIYKALTLDLKEKQNWTKIWLNQLYFYIFLLLINYVK